MASPAQRHAYHQLAQPPPRQSCEEATREEFNSALVAIGAGGVDEVLLAKGIALLLWISLPREIRIGAQYCEHPQPATGDETLAPRVGGQGVSMHGLHTWGGHVLIRCRACSVMLSESAL